MSDDAPAAGLTARTEQFQLHIEIQRGGLTLEEFQSDFSNFHWEIPSSVTFIQPVSGLAAHLTLNAFETTIKDHSGDLIHVLAGGVADLHANGDIELGAHAQIDYRLLQFSDATLTIGVEGTVSVDPSSGSGSVEFAPVLSLSFGGTGHP